MTYQTGTATNVDDLLAKLSTFAVTAGWTEEKVVAGSGDGASSELYLSKGTIFVTFEAMLTGGNNVYHGINQALDHPHLEMKGATGFDGGETVANQPGTHTAGCETNWLLPNMTAFHFFTDPTKTYIHVAIETTANEFRHIHFGILDKLGAYTGGEYITACQHFQSASFIDEPMNFQHSWPWVQIGNSGPVHQQLRVVADGETWHQAVGNNTNNNQWFPPMQGAAQGFPIEDFLEVKSNTSKAAQPNTFNSTVVLFQLPCHIRRSSTKKTPVGKPHDLRMCNMQNVSPATSIFFGGDEWVIFPVIQKKDPGLRDNLPNSAFLAYAYKKIP